MIKTYSTPLQSGFSLLEMVLVLLIMGMIASLSTVFIDNEDNQLRYEETILKLEAMHKATVTVKDYKDSFIFSGFVVENGVLPNQTIDYIKRPTDWIERTLFNDGTKPEYRIKDINDHNEIVGVSLYKGYRSGYIAQGTDSNSDYKTGWGQDFTVQEDTDSHELILSYDELLNPPDYNHHVNKNVPADNWSIPLSELNITVENQKGEDITSTTPIYIVIIVFKNIQTNTTDADKSNDSVWQTYHFKLTGLVANTDTHNHAHNSINNDAPWKNEADTGATATRIPAGEHIVFVAVDSNNDNKIVSAEIKGQAVLKVIPRFTQPNMTLVIPKD